MDLNKMPLWSKILLPSEKTTMLTLGGTAVLLGLLTACGNPSHSDSLKKYSDLRKTMGPPHQQKPVVQSYIPSDLYTLELDASTPPTFIVGQKNTLRFRTAINLPDVKYRLVSRDLPRGSEPLREVSPGVWELTWTPNPELISANMNGIVRGGFHVALEVYQVNSDRSRALVNGLATDREVNYSLLRSGIAPEIISVKGVAAYPQTTRITEGDVLEFVVEVKDPSSTATQKPRLLPIATRNRLSKENSVISGHAFLFLDNEPVMTSPGLWQFKAIFDTKNNSVPEFNVEGQPLLVPQIQADLSLQILSANRSVSPIKTITFEITYRRELLKPAFKANPELQKVTQNGQWSYSFESYLPSAVGTLTTYLSDETVKLPGTPKLTCKTDKKRVNRQICRVDWKVPCAMPSGDVVIKVLGAAEYQGQNTSMELQKNLSILENKKCVPPSAKTSTPDTGAGQSANGPTVEATTGAVAPATANVTPQKKAAKSVPKNTKPSKTADHKTKGAHS